MTKNIIFKILREIWWVICRLSSRLNAIDTTAMTKYCDELKQYNKLARTWAFICVIFKVNLLDFRNIVFVVLVRINFRMILLHTNTSKTVVDSRVWLKKEITSHNGGNITVKLPLKDSVSNETSELMTKKNPHRKNSIKVL